MRRRRKWLLLLRATALLVALSFPLAATRPVHDLPPPIMLTVRDEVRYMRPGLTFANAARRFHLRARSGHLLDVDGLVLERNAYPGRVLLNGHGAVAWEPLSDGDAIDVVHGEDRTEPTEDVVREFPGGRPGNPQHTLATQPGVEITTRGRLSKKLVSVEFRPSGDAQVPPAVALTFDDGPSPTFTPQVLAILRRFGVPATFFVVGYLAERFPELVREAAEVGTVASHSYGHPIGTPFADLPRKRIVEEMDGASDVLEGLGLRITLFRPPGGSSDDRVVKLAGRRGMRVVMWSVDPEDWRNDAKRKLIVRAVVRNVQPGSIILLHDGGGDQSATVAALPAIIKKIRKMGLRFTVVAKQD